jgi:hypothetical protein
VFRTELTCAAMTMPSEARSGFGFAGAGDCLSNPRIGCCFCVYVNDTEKAIRVNDDDHDDDSRGHISPDAVCLNKRSAGPCRQLGAHPCVMLSQ